MPLQLSRFPSASSRVLPNWSPISSSSSMSALYPLVGTVCHPHYPICSNAYVLYDGLVHLFWPVAKIRWHAWCARIRTLSISSAVREAAARKFLDDLCPVGQNPLDWTIVTKAWAGMYHIVLIRRNYILFLAGVDDCDYNLHLSNSSYPKVNYLSLSFLSSPRIFCAMGTAWGLGRRGTILNMMAACVVPYN